MKRKDSARKMNNTLICIKIAANIDLIKDKYGVSVN